MSLSGTRRAAGVVHPCLASASAIASRWARRRLTDRRKVAASCWRRRGCCRCSTGRVAAGRGMGAGADRRPAGWWSGEDGAVPGRSAWTPQTRQYCCSTSAAGCSARDVVAGRGEARRAVRASCSTPGGSPWRPCRLTRRWRPSWRPRPFSGRRTTRRRARPWRVGSRTGGRVASAWIAGPRSLRSRLLAQGLSVPELAELLASPAAAGAVERRGGRDARGAGRRGALAGGGRRLGAPAAGDGGGADRAGRGPCGARAGSRPPWRRWPACTPRRPGRSRPAASSSLGRLGAARVALRGLEDAPLAPVQVAELAEIASRVCANHGKPGRAGFWIRRALDETAGDPRALDPRPSRRRGRGLGPA